MGKRNGGMWTRALDCLNGLCHGCGYLWYFSCCQVFKFTLDVRVLSKNHIPSIACPRYGATKRVLTTHTEIKYPSSPTAGIIPNSRPNPKALNHSSPSTTRYNPYSMPRPQDIWHGCTLYTILFETNCHKEIRHGLALLRLRFRL
jgi:hypothetical protein